MRPIIGCVIIAIRLLILKIYIQAIWQAKQQPTQRCVPIAADVLRNDVQVAMKNRKFLDGKDCVPELRRC